MRNSFSVIAAAFMLAAVLGCGITDRVKKEMGGETNVANANVNANANKTITDRAIDSVAGEGKVGIAECDEVIDIFAAQANNPEDNFVTKAVKQTALTKFREEVKRRLDDNKANRTDIGKYCRDIKASLGTAQSEPEANKK